MVEIVDKSLEGLRFVDLFAGLGGFRLALESLGAGCVWSSEWDRAAQEVYRLNFGIVPHGDITRVREDEVPPHDILCAGFPCQAFSISGRQRGFEDSRGTLFFDVARIARARRPQVVFMENVRNFAVHNGGRTLAVVRGTMEDLGYSFHSKVLDAADYGVPQRRERIYMVCFRRDLGVEGFEFPPPSPLERHVQDLLLDDPGQVEGLWVDRDDAFWKPAPEGAMTNRPVRIGTVGKGGQGERIYSVKGAAITLSAYGGGIFAKTGGYLVGGRPRRLHIRECARLMGYPDSYRFCGSAAQTYKQLGNSVVVDVLQQIAVRIGEALGRSQA